MKGQHDVKNLNHDRVLGKLLYLKQYWNRVDKETESNLRAYIRRWIHKG